jgi:hypothetical protein
VAESGIEETGNRARIQSTEGWSVARMNTAQEKRKIDRRKKDHTPEIAADKGRQTAL